MRRRDRKRWRYTLARWALAGGLVVTGCRATESGSRGGAPVVGDTEGQVERVELAQNAPGWLGDVRVVVFNFRERTYTDTSGAERTGMSALFSTVDPAKEQVAGPGGQVQVGASRYEVVSVTRPESGQGRVVLSPIAE